MLLCLIKKTNNNLLNDMKQKNEHHRTWLCPRLIILCRPTSDTPVASKNNQHGKSWYPSVIAELSLYIFLYIVCMFSVCLLLYDIDVIFACYFDL